MKTSYTYTNAQETNRRSMRHIAAILSFLFVCFTLQPLYAQSGKLKLRGDIVNVADEQTKSLITLFRIQDNSDQKFVLGQFVVTGNEWFKTHLQLDKEYMVEIASTDGLTKRFTFNTHVPAELANSRLRLDLSFNMAATEANWDVVNGGEVSYSNRADAFALSK